MSEIKKTKLYKELKKLDKSFANEVLKNSNEIIELINKKTTINFPNYTNHDIRHSIKIMETMYELIKDKTERLSSLEYALMIYAAMFHDIGMAVSDEEINKIKKNDSKYLYNQDFKLIKENLYNNEELAIQEVVRNAHGKIANDLINTKYKELFKLPQSSTYFSEELGMICQAHTEDKSYLEKISTYETKGDDEYNPRFVAILLRVADILDIDDTRTPIELYNTIELSDFSDGEWQKNFVIDNRKKIFSRNKLKEIRLQGTCEDIKVHRKLLNYIKWIENELIILVNETADMEEYYHIQINTQVQNKIKSKGYTIPDLKLNMDYHAVTNLLMGEAIYGSKDLGLRELLQNSIDAIMVKKDKLEIENHPLKDSYEPTININIDEKNDKVIISDNGMGMDEYIIKNYFLNVGKSYYKSKDFLNYNHHYNPIGNFGIGFLSCFMLSDEVQVITKHFNANKKYTIDLEKNSEYIAFKEEEDNNIESGTKIILNLNSFRNIIMKRDNSVTEIHNFINKYLFIENFLLKINGNNISNNKINIESNYIINLNDYLFDIEGYLEIDKSNYLIDTISEDIEFSFSSYFFNDDKLEKIDYTDNLKLTDIVADNQLNYIKIPLINDFDTYEKVNAIIEASPWDIKDEIEYKYIDNYICLFLNNKFSINSSDNTIFIDDEIFAKNGENYNFEFLEKNILDLKNYYVPIIFSEKTNLLYEDKNIMEFKSYNQYFIYENKKHKVSIKNIIVNYKTNFFLSDYIKIKNSQINLKNNNLHFNISRTSLTSESEKELNYALGKIIHEYALKNFTFEIYEKKLLENFIEKFYSEKNILFK